MGAPVIILAGAAPCCAGRGEIEVKTSIKYLYENSGCYSGNLIS
jgi:hypothetical protein